VLDRDLARYGEGGPSVAKRRGTGHKFLYLRFDKTRVLGWSAVCQHTRMRAPLSIKKRKDCDQAGLQGGWAFGFSQVSIRGESRVLGSHPSNGNETSARRGGVPTETTIMCRVLRPAACGRGII
jgi:hypothetical protein